jgi:hypothetical protein
LFFSGGGVTFVLSSHHKKMKHDPKNQTICRNCNLKLQPKGTNHYFIHWRSNTMM